MSIAAVLLAAAVLLGPGPRRVGCRAASSPVSHRPVSRRRPAHDPLAAASALDVFAVCLSAGMAVPNAAAVTASSAPPLLRTVLNRAADLLALGADADTAWPGGVDDPACESLMLLARRSAASGTALAHGVAELADKSRADAAHAADAAAERAGVLIAGPLGLCFLPAFVCLGIVPVVVGLAGEVFNGWLL